MGEMRFRRLGSSGLAVSVVGVGCNNFGRRIDSDRVAEVVGAALDIGINLFDTADTYGDPAGRSEELLGAALGARRDEAVVATKFGSDVRGALGPDWGARGGRRYIHRAVEASLRRLGTDYIDLYQIHEPDQATPIEETLSTLDDLVHAGKVRYIGSSNFAGWQVADAAIRAQERNLTPFISAQNEYSLLNRDAELELIPACERFGVGVLPYFPLASGLLSGKYHRGELAPAGTRLAEPRSARWLADAPWDLLEELSRYAEKRGRTLLDVAIGALLARRAVASVIAGATSAEQIRTNAAAADWQPTPDDLTALEEILER
jgi:aryl-alcohol dehydrogenase-like predicted oxidoreductase